MREGDADRGERLIKQALELEPDAPDLWNNLTAAYSRQGREQDATAIVRQIHERHPDYLFGRTNLALVHLQAGEIGAARALLEPLLSRKRFHVSEMSALMNAELELAVAQNNLDAAQSWLSLWMQVDPDNPVLAAWQRRLEKPGRQRLFGRRG